MAIEKYYIPIVREAIQWDGEVTDDRLALLLQDTEIRIIPVLNINNKWEFHLFKSSINCGNSCRIGDYIVFDSDTSFYFVSKDVFEEKYKKVEE